MQLLQIPTRATTPTVAPSWGPWACPAETLELSQGQLSLEIEGVAGSKREGSEATDGLQAVEGTVRSHFICLHWQLCSPPLGVMAGEAAMQVQDRTRELLAPAPTREPSGPHDTHCQRWSEMFATLQLHLVCQLLPNG